MKAGSQGDNSIRSIALRRAASSAEGAARSHNERGRDGVKCTKRVWEAAVFLISAWSGIKLLPQIRSPFRQEGR